MAEKAFSVFEGGPVRIRIKPMVRFLKFFWVIARLVLCFIILSVFVYESYSILTFYREGDLPLPSTFGNFREVRNLLGDDGEAGSFSFAVVGDTRGHGTLGFGTFERIVEKLKEEDLAFMILLGDCVRRGTEGYHRYLRAEWAEELATPFPVFYVVGNHDIHKEKFPLSEFERYYGPTNFFFTYKQNLFIVTRILNEPYSNEESMAFLESVLSRHRSNYKKVFIFMHNPLFRTSHHSTKLVYGNQELKSLIAEYDVDYVIAGDYHGYFRKKTGDTVYIVTGGGGAELVEAKFGRFYHAIVMNVGLDTVSEDILSVERNENLEDWLECVALAEVFPWLRKNKPAALAFNIVIAVFLFLTVRSLTRSCRS